ncbi:MAG: FAD-binding oxidoreductase, partial [Chthonomonadaceae bacterium]|nr:FAD-binding oxidoreductase [Chthonomonadaceae bacterium]
MSEAPSDLSAPTSLLPATRMYGPALPADHLEPVEAWGMNRRVMSYVFRPSTIAGIRAVFDIARQHGLTVGLRGGGRSYGDAALNAEQICLDLTRMNRILEWDPETGVICVEPGVTLRQLWQYVIGDGWWPPVVSGTMFVTMGGAAGMNFHGKNNWKMGPIGEHVREFDLLLPSGTVLTCSPDQNADLFYAAIGGLGMLGCFTRLTLQMKRVYSGYLEVRAFAGRNLTEILQAFEDRLSSADYLVAWIDCFARGTHLGRGQIHEARYLQEDEDPAPAQSLRVECQELPDTLFGLIPKSVMWRLMKPFVHNPGMRLINGAKYLAGATLGHHRTYWQSHAGFAFLLDYVPDWKWVYKPGGLIQFQSFVPAERAEQCFATQLALCQQRGIVPYLGVLKRHRRDRFLLSHAVDGYSLALDFPVTRRNRERLWQLTAD